MLHAAEARGQTAIVNSLRDPESFRLIGWEGPFPVGKLSFKGSEVWWYTPLPEGKARAVQCRYRAKNGFGGYNVVVQSFLYDGKALTALPREGAGAMAELDHPLAEVLKNKRFRVTP